MVRSSLEASVRLIPSSYLAASSSQSFSVPNILCLIYYLGLGKGREAAKNAVKEAVKEVV